MLRPLILAALPALVAGCVPDSEFAAVEIVPRATVRGAVQAELEVMGLDFSESRIIPMAAGDRGVSASIPRDTVWVTARMIDAAGAEVASGEGPPRSRITLDPADFAVNVEGTSCAFGPEAVTGRQLARLDDGSLAVVWQSDVGSGFVQGRAFDPTGAPSGIGERGVDGEVRLTPIDPEDTGLSSGAHLVAAGDHYLLAHDQFVFAENSHVGEVLILDRDLEVKAIVPRTRFASEDASQLAVAPLDAGGLAIAWVAASRDVEGPRRVTFLPAAGPPIAEVVLPGNGVHPQIARSASGLVAVLDGRVDQARSPLTLHVFDQRGAAQGDPVVLDADFSAFDQPARITAAGDGFLVAWLAKAEATTVRVVRIGADRVPGKPVDIATVDDLDGLAISADAAGGAGIAWAATNGTDEGTGQVTWTALDRDLAPRFAARRITATTAPQQTPSITSADGGFAIAWTQLGEEAPALIRARFVYPPTSP